MSASWKPRAIPFPGILALVITVFASTLTLANAPRDTQPLEAAASLALDGLDSRATKEMRDVRARPSLPYYVETEHFRIWYDTTGPDMIYGWPDTTHLHDCKVVAERSWRGLIDTLGFRPPPPDGSDPDGGGGSDHYDVYVRDIMGMCGYTSNGYSAPGGPPGDMTSFIVLDNDFMCSSHPTPAVALRDVLPFLFGYAIELAHDVDEADWYMPATSMWCAERMYDEVNGMVNPYYGVVFLQSVLGQPYLSMDEGDLIRQCGMGLWNLYLSENHGAGIIPEIWFACEVVQGDDALACMDDILDGYGTSLGDAVEEFCVCNWFTGDRDDGNHYEEGGDPGWPEASAQATFATLPVVNGSPPAALRPDHLACNYIHLQRGSYAGDVLHITYEGPTQASVPSAAHIAYLDNDLDAFYYGEILLDSMGDGSISVEGFDGMNTVCLVVVNKSLGADDMYYRFDADIWTGVPEGVEFSLSPAAPNPFALGTEIAFSIPPGVGAHELSIYDVSGRLVTTLVDGAMSPGRAVAYWDGTDANGRDVASGVYFAKLVADQRSTQRKIAVLR